MPQRKPRLTKGRMKAAITEAHGIAGSAMRALGCSRSAFYAALKRHRLQAHLEAERLALIDVAEDHLRTGILKGKPWALSFILRTIGSARWREAPQTIEIVRPVRKIEFDPAAPTPKPPRGSRGFFIPKAEDKPQ